MENVDLNHLTRIHQVILDARHELDNIAAQEREELDSLSFFTRSCCMEPLRRLDAVDETVRMLAQAEEMIELALSYRHSYEDSRIKFELEASMKLDTTY